MPNSSSIFSPCFTNELDFDISCLPCNQCCFFYLSHWDQAAYLGGFGDVLGEGAGERVRGGTGGGTSRRFIAGESNGEPRSRARAVTASA